MTQAFPGQLEIWGVISRKSQDPKNRSGLRLLFAPDVARGADGRFYLYYAFDFMGMMGVAVADQRMARQYIANMRGRSV